mgnify:CR=1 FL=1
MYRVCFYFCQANAGYHGVAARIALPDAQTWGPPLYLLNYGGPADGGYPSSVQLADGTIVTAYYCRRAVSHQRYHMGAAVWTLPTA